MYMLPSMHQLHTILAGSSGLESLALEELRFSIIGHENDSSKLPPIILPSLHTLKLDHINMEANSLILSTLIAPNLVRLSLGGMEGEGDTNLLSTFIKGLQQTIVLKSGSTVIESSLRCLRLAECRFQSATVEKMILSLTNLRDITFCLMGCVTDTLFSSLVIPDQEEMGSSHACKRLRVMRILYCYNLTRINVLKKVVTSRKGAHQGSDGQELDGLMVYKCPIEDEARSGEWFRQNVRNVHWSCNQSG
ncbi:hypothetical protein FRC03_005219 [Tulasnella sp. 419]|nr:hypothetical protein FRC03_005219 [Tulasnella sp. 419]